MNLRNGKDKIIDLYRLGFSYSTIQKITKKSYVTVINTCKEYKNRYGEPEFSPLTDEKKMIIEESIKNGTFRITLLARLTGCRGEDIIEYLYELVKQGKVDAEFIYDYLE